MSGPDVGEPPVGQIGVELAGERSSCFEELAESELEAEA